MRFFNLVLSTSFLISILTSSPSRALEISDFLKNPLAMTISQVLAIPSKDDSGAETVNTLPKRAKTFLFEDRHDSRFRYLLQPSPTAPLVFVLPGTGGVSSSGAALFLAEKLHAQGYHVVTLDNPFSWTFAISSSRSSRPGYVPDDAIDLYAVLQKIRTKLRRDKKIAPRSYSLVSYSLGGLQSVFLKRIDDRVQTFRFEKLLLINPAIDLLHALRFIDGLHARSAKLSENDRNWVMGQVASVANKYMSRRTKIDFADPSFMTAAFQDLGFNDDEMGFLISKAFRDSLRDVIFASQQVQDLRILKKKVTRYRRDARYSEAASFSFMQYVNLFLMPALKKQKGSDFTVDKLNDLASLYQFGEYLRTQPGIFVVHSQDDFILKDGDIEWLKSHLGARLSVFPYGGHCGSMNFPQFASILASVFPKR